MNELEQREIDCPYCGESIDVFIDTSELPQQYIEDCQVCCRPINFDVSEDLDGDIMVRISHEND